MPIAEYTSRVLIVLAALLKQRYNTLSKLPNLFLKKRFFYFKRYSYLCILNQSKMKKQNVNNDLNEHANGTEQWHEVLGLFPNHTMTDGVKHLAEMCNAFWLLDTILSHQLYKKVSQQPFQVWQLKHTENDAYLLTCEDGNDNQVSQQKIPYSNFPYEVATIWLVDRVLLLPCEY